MDINKCRTRYYGHRIGDLVDTGENGHRDAIVVEYGHLDNNKIWVRDINGERHYCVAEWCKPLDRVKD